MDFQSFGKISRLSREVVITEKIDGTNAQILLYPTHNSYNGEFLPYILHQYPAYNDLGDRLALMAGSRTRWLKPGEDNFGFANWAIQNKDSLLELGEGRHYGEWWGKGIQRGYDIKEKRFSLFNTNRWNSGWNLNNTDIGDNVCLEIPICDVVPIIGRTNFYTDVISKCLNNLETNGSYAKPGFMEPEGIVIYHTAGGVYFKKTIKNDEKPKGSKE